MNIGNRNVLKTRRNVSFDTEYDCYLSSIDSLEYIMFEEKDERHTKNGYIPYCLLQQTHFFI